jgi:hypothetical protein
MRLNIEDYKRSINKKFDALAGQLDTIDANEIYFRKWINDIEEKVNINDATTNEKFQAFTRSVFDLSMMHNRLEDEWKLKFKGTMLNRS